MDGLFQNLFANAPALLCLVIGYALVVLEMCIPGFGVPGTLGIILLLVGILTGTASVVHALILAGIMIVLLLIALPFCLRFIGKGRFSKSRLVLRDTSVPAKGLVNDLDKYKGREGVALTLLRPAGVVAFDDDKLSVVSDGAFIPEGARVRVERVEGNRVVVVRIEEGAEKGT